MFNAINMRQKLIMDCLFLSLNDSSAFILLQLKFMCNIIITTTEKKVICFWDFYFYSNANGFCDV